LGEHCEAHSGVGARMDNAERWQTHHEEVTHVELNKKVDRPQQWVIFMMTGMGTVIGFLGGLLTAIMRLKG
jgi:hypothetical protein